MTETTFKFRWAKNGKTREWNAPTWLARTVLVVVGALIGLPWFFGWVYFAQLIHELG